MNSTCCTLSKDMYRSTLQYINRIRHRHYNGISNLPNVGNEVPSCRKQEFNFSSNGEMYWSRLYSSDKGASLLPVSMAYSSFKNTNFSDQIGAPPIIIMHGLMGSKLNWRSLAKVINLKTGRTVYTVDARNHGESPHTPEMNYLLLAEDLKYFLKEHSIVKACLIGHSMGGRAAMAFALNNSSLIEKLFVVDISPMSTPETISTLPQFVDIMRKVVLPSSLSLPEARKHVDVLLKDIIEEASIRMFLLSNLAQRGDEFYWKVNLDAIAEHFEPHISQFPMNHLINSFTGFTHFLAGGLSKYISPTDEEEIRKIFPKATFSYVEDAGHWVHADKPQEFLDQIVPSIMS